MRATRQRRERGEFNVTDLVVGLVLAALIPGLAAFVLPMVGFPLTLRVGSDVAQKTRIERVPPTPKEIQDLFEVSTEILDQNALHYMRLWRNEKSSTAKMQERNWAKASLEVSKSKFEELILTVQNAPPGSLPPNVVGLAGTAQARLREIQGCFAELEDDNPLGL